MEKDIMDNKVIDIKALEGLRSNTQLGFSSMQVGPTYELRQHI